MLHEIAFMRNRFVTYSTYIWAAISVRKQMFIQMTLLTKLSTAYVTLERTTVCVRKQMNIEMTLLYKRFLAYVTFIRSVIGVSVNVPN